MRDTIKFGKCMEETLLEGGYSSIYAVLLDGNLTSSLSQALGSERSINYSLMMTTKTGEFFEC